MSIFILNEISGFAPKFPKRVRCQFMSVKERPVYTSANLAMFMVNLSHALIRPMRDQWPAFSINDLKAWFRGRKYAVEMLKLLPESPDAIFIDQVVAHMAELGRVNHALNPS